MDITPHVTDQALLAELGRRLARQRLDRGITQAELAAQSGVSKRTVERIESGGSAQLVSFVRVLRTLGLLERLNALLPETGPSPLELLKLRGKPRRRASGRRSAETAGEKAGEKAEQSSRRRGSDWTWGDDT